MIKVKEKQSQRSSKRGSETNDGQVCRRRLRRTNERSEETNETAIEHRMKGSGETDTGEKRGVSKLSKGSVAMPYSDCSIWYSICI